MLFTISCDTTFALERPMNTSAPTIASCRSMEDISCANCILCSSRSVRLFTMRPLLSNIYIFFTFAPRARYILQQEIADAPAPLITIFTSASFLPTIPIALSKAAPLIIAVPCWSSCIIGMLSSFLSLVSISKHSGAFMSSRFMPPNVGSKAFTTAMNSSTFFVFSSMSKTSISAYILNNSPLPSITGFDASGPMSPRPNTAVPLLITATRLPLAV